MIKPKYILIVHIISLILHIIIDNYYTAWFVLVSGVIYGIMCFIGAANWIKQAVIELEELEKEPFK
jgi:hypothetical protein